MRGALARRSSRRTCTRSWRWAGAAAARSSSWRCTPARARSTCATATPSPTMAASRTCAACAPPAEPLPLHALLFLDQESCLWRKVGGQTQQRPQPDVALHAHAQVTAILYANPGWCPADGGKLRLWPPRTAEAAAPAGGSSVAGAPANARGAADGLNTCAAGLGDSRVGMDLDAAAGYSPRASLGHSDSAQANGEGCAPPEEHAHGHANGYANGHANGYANSHANGCDSASPAQGARARSGAAFLADANNSGSSPHAHANGHHHAENGIGNGLHRSLSSGLSNGYPGAHSELPPHALPPPGSPPQQHELMRRLGLLMHASLQCAIRQQQQHKPGEEFATRQQAAAQPNQEPVLRARRRGQGQCAAVGLGGRAGGVQRRGQRLRVLPLQRGRRVRARRRGQPLPAPARMPGALLCAHCLACVIHWKGQ